MSEAQNKKFIKLCNKVLHLYRQQTQDIFLTAFKGLRSDGLYRRRLDFTVARQIVAKAYQEMFE